MQGKNVCTGKSSTLLSTLKQHLVMSLIQCHYDYVCCIWYKGLNTKLQTIQNKLIRFVLDLESRAHISKEPLNC